MNLRMQIPFKEAMRGWLKGPADNQEVFRVEGFLLGEFVRSILGWSRRKWNQLYRAFGVACFFRKGGEKKPESTYNQLELI